MKNLIISIIAMFVVSTAAMAQCTALWLGGSNNNNMAYFYDSSSTDPNVTTYLWGFGDGATSTDQNPIHQYATNGWQNICLSIETQINGSICQNTHCDSMYIGQMPSLPSCHPYFVSSDSARGGNVIYFDNYSYYQGGTVYYHWDFGDGDTSNLENPTHTYAILDTYNVCLTQYVYDNGVIVCTDVFCYTVNATWPITCNAAFYSSSNGLNAYFYSYGLSGYGYSWDFGDNTSSTHRNPSHTYASAGTYAVCLTILDSLTNCTDTHCSNITVANIVTPNCAANWIGWSDSTNMAYFTDSSNTDPNVTTYFWYFGDGDSSTLQHPTHQYASAGQYNVCFLVETQVNGTLCSDYNCDTIIIGQQSNYCNAYFNPNSTPSDPNIFHFANQSQTSGNQLNYSWDFGDNTSSSASNPSHTYASAGTYTVCLTVNDPQTNCTDTYCTNVTVINIANPSCNAYWVGWSDSTNMGYFADSSFTDPNVTTYLWDFGDGNTSTDQHPTHQYATLGYYNVCFSIETQINGSLCTDTRCDSIFIGPQGINCYAGFYTSASPSNPNEVSFANHVTSTVAPSIYSWSFGDGNISGSANPTHTYASQGIYNACLIISTVLNGVMICSDTACMNVTVGTAVSCNAQFVTTLINAATQEYAFDASNTQGIVYDHQWQLSDGASYNTESFSHQFTVPGLNTVCHTVTYTYPNATTCTRTTCDTISIFGTANCDASFSAAPSPSNPALIVFSTPNPTGSGIHYYNWSFGDGRVYYARNAEHEYTFAGSYNVCLVIREEDGLGNVNCTDTVCQVIQAPGNGLGVRLNGRIFTDSTSGIWNEAEVFLIQYDSISGSLNLIDTAHTLNSIFTFQVMAPGNYLLKAALLPGQPSYSDFLPTYYHTELFWQNATSVEIVYSNQFVNLALIPGNNPGGPGFIGGNVNQGANKQASGDALEGIQVMLLNLDDSPVQYTYTNASGSFSFSNVALGTYKVYAEVLGKPTYPVTVTLTAAQESVENVAIVVEEEGVYSSVTEVSNTFLTEANFYPNPVNSIGTVSFNAKEAGNLTLQVVNMLGQVVAEQEMNVLPGNQLATVDMGGQQAGVYFLTISFNNHVAAHLRFIRD